jgi:threonine synthase
MFNDFEFRDGVNLAGVNSINWARVLAQVVYYFSSAVKLGAPNKKISFSVPTGNFGDIFAGFIAKKMGLSIDRLVVATNQNDILHRCLTSGVYKTDKVLPSISPSMDIQVSSNFERALFYAADCDSKKVSALMDELKNTGQFKVSESILEKLQECFVSGRVSEEETLSEIAYSYQKYSEILCPHSAVGVFVGRKQSDADVPMVTLATAHPAKFPKAVEKATSIYPKLPSRMADLFDLKERITIVENNLQSIESVVRERIQT